MQISILGKTRRKQSLGESLRSDIMIRCLKRGIRGLFFFPPKILDQKLTFKVNVKNKCSINFSSSYFSDLREIKWQGYIHKKTTTLRCIIQIKQLGLFFFRIKKEKLKTLVNISKTAMAHNAKLNLSSKH